MALVVETPIGAIDGVNDTFDTPTEYVPGTLKHILNGVVMDPALDNGLTENGGTSFTLKEVPLTTANLLVIYDDGQLTEPRLDVRVKTRSMVLLFDADYRSRKFVFVQGDTAPPLFFTVTDENGAAVSLIGSTLAFKFRKLGDTVQFNADDSVTILSGINGEAKYDWKTGDLDEIGEYEGELQITSGAVIQTTVATLRFTIRRQIG